MEQKHSPLPWVESDGTEIKDANGILCAIASSFHFGYKKARDNRELIVRAVNSTPAFDALIEKSEVILRCLAAADLPSFKEAGEFLEAIQEAKKARGI